MRYLMSDIHGDCTHFEQMMEKIQFSSSDVLYILGDVIDRGSQNMELLGKVRSDKRIHLIKGNHELFAQMYLNGEIDMQRWDLWGGGHTRKEVERLSEKERQELRDYFASLPLWESVMWGETPCILTHTGYHADYPVCHADQSIDIQKSIQLAVQANEFEYLVSMDLYHIPAKLEFDRYLIVGHCPISLFQREGHHQRKGSIYRSRRYLDLDCGNGHREEGGRLGCLRMEDGQMFYV